ncbi:uncharacterized protein LOC143321789 [Chaetodon auriga]|uniref:uncharacterized protein LOC143321789 n=1 Tax=Chaetodon auriga TaxID=39042 RepID=UPI004033040B
MDAYKRAAPHLLNELARLLSHHKWCEKGCIPHGIVNILNYSWQDLTAGASIQEQRCKEKSTFLKLDEARSRQVSPDEKREAGQRGSCAVEGVKPQVSSNPRVKKRKQSHHRAHNSATISLANSSNTCKHRGWIIQPKPPCCDEPQWISLCQWVVERLQVARNPEKLQTAYQDLEKPLMLRHYGEAKAKVKDGRVRRKAHPATLVDRLSQIPEVKQQDPAQQKLHYRIDDGSSFIYYPSGCMAVCQSHSGLPCGGFYTNVFSDDERPVILATITASGHALPSQQYGTRMVDSHVTVMVT